MMRSLSADLPRVKTNKRITYWNISASFDIETTSFSVDGEKCATMYEWTFGLEGFITYGRTWEEFLELYNELVEIFHTDLSNRLVIFVHNLAYEFQFMRKWLCWEKVFSLEERKPVQAITVEGVEFRCSYKLSGYSLAKLSDQLQTYRCKKAVGDLDYSKIRNSVTPLTDDELRYCALDVLVVMCYVQELIEREGNISKIPLTKTGFVRRLCRDKCLYEGDDKFKTKYRNYRNTMKSLTLTPEVYTLLQQAFSGGFTHANALYSQDVVKNVTSYDFTSSYPYVMVSEKFPMSSPIERVDFSEEDFITYLKSYCCLFEIEFMNIRASVDFENYISVSKCRAVKNPVINNGRLVSADRIRMTITEQDYFIICKMYSWDDYGIGKFYTFRKDYLPRDFVKAILELYSKKTTLKGIESKAVEYLVSKENLNSCYGMCVTNICRPEILYEGYEWDRHAPDIEDAIMKNNRAVKRFLYYPWGIWVTAYARANLFTGILELGDDYVYSDTDSIKGLNMEKHIDYIKSYNSMCITKLHRACDYHKIPFDDVQPRTIEGIAKPLGVWDFDGFYTRFKTLGAKRYLVEYVNKQSNQLDQKLTVAGLSKSVALGYMKRLAKQQGVDVFEVFNSDLYIPKGETGKKIHTYIDNECYGQLTDYLGNRAPFRELSSIHLDEADYSFSLTEEYIDFLLGIKNEELNGYE